MSGRRKFAAVLATTLVGVALLGAGAAEAVVGSASLALTPPRTVFGGAVEATGNLETDAACLGGRQVRLEHLAPGGTTWESLAATRTAADGGFALEVRPETNATYRARILLEVRAETTCAEVISDEVAGWVRAHVTAEVLTEPVRAGRCGRVRVQVRPGKPGQEIEVRRRVDGGWRVVAAGTLGTGSRAVTRVCTAWPDLGRVRIRARWPAQDDLHVTGQSPRHSFRVVKATWMRRIDRLAGGAVGVSVREDGVFQYRHRDDVPRTPASNQKLLLSMALLDSLPSHLRMPTRVMAPEPGTGVIRGDLWLVGSGDPEVGRRHLRRLARRVDAAGIRRVTGAVRGSLRFFKRDWWAPGWKPSFPARYIPRPTALTYRGNVDGGRHVADPERRAARDLTRFLRRRGVRVAGKPGVGRHPTGLTELARVRSRSLEDLLRTTNVYSSNFRAEVLGKRLAVARFAAPGSIAKGARAIAAFAADHGVGVTAHDSSGLSYANRVAPVGMVRLLEAAEGASWGAVLRSSLPGPGQGTLEHRLSGVPLRAKTGTLTARSALSGWVRSRRSDTWVEFSIISSGLSTSRAKAIEDEIVRILHRRV